MLWIIVLIIVVIIAFIVPKFGKTLLIGIAVLVAIGFLWYLNNRHEEEVSKKRISHTEIQFDDLRLMPSYSAASFRLSGRLKNKSQRFSLQDIRIKITMRDCIKPGECEIVGETTASTFATVPPGQSRDVDESVYFSNLAKPKGKYEWGYYIVEIKGN
jgi:hypothetical protein